MTYIFIIIIIIIMQLVACKYIFNLYRTMHVCIVYTTVLCASLCCEGFKFSLDSVGPLDSSLAFDD